MSFEEKREEWIEWLDNFNNTIDDKTRICYLMSGRIPSRYVISLFTDGYTVNQAIKFIHKLKAMC